MAGANKKKNGLPFGQHYNKQGKAVRNRGKQDYDQQPPVWETTSATADVTQTGLTGMQGKAWAKEHGNAAGFKAGDESSQQHFSDDFINSLLGIKKGLTGNKSGSGGGSGGGGGGGGGGKGKKNKPVTKGKKKTGTKKGFHVSKSGDVVKNKGNRRK